MQSPTSEVKEIIVNLLESKQEVKVPIAEIKNEIGLKVVQEITEGVVAGALHTLTKDKQSGVISPTRGFYMYSPQSIEQIEDLTVPMFIGIQESIKTLKSVLKSIDILQIDEKDLPNIQIMNGLIEDMEEFTGKLSETYQQRNKESADITKNHL